MDPRQQIFEFLSGSYGRPATAVAEALQRPLEEVQELLAAMVLSRTLLLIDGKYRCNLGVPFWYHKVMNCLHWEALTGFTHVLVPEDNNLIIAPLPYEMEGQRKSKNRGPCYEPFHCDLTALLALFDGTPHLALGQQQKTALDIEGKIDGDDAWITIEDQPDFDDKPMGKMYKDGSFEYYPEEATS